MKLDHLKTLHVPDIEQAIALHIAAAEANAPSPKDRPMRSVSVESWNLGGGGRLVVSGPAPQAVPGTLVLDGTRVTIECVPECVPECVLQVSGTDGTKVLVSNGNVAIKVLKGEPACSDAPRP